MPLRTTLGGQHTPELPPDYLAEIGRVSARWNMLDGYLDLSLILLLGKKITETRSLVIFTHMSFPQKLDVFAALISELLKTPSNDRLRSYRATVTSLKEAQRLRNLVVHGKWGMTPDGNVTASTITARGKFAANTTPMPIEQIIDASNAIYDALDSLFRLVWEPRSE
jgi:hypothetical protein